MRLNVAIGWLLMISACRRSASADSTTRLAAPAGAGGITLADTAGDDSAAAGSYEGMDGRGIPHYATLAIPPVDSLLLRRAYGIEDPHRLYVSDSTEEGMLKYDTKAKRCRTCYVNSYRVGYVSVRRPGESWEEAERRVRTTSPRTFTGSAVPSSTSTADLDPDVKPIAEAMLRDARAAGFRIRVTATYRSPLREAYLMAEGPGRTHTLTSNHSYGRALDIVVDDGNRRHAATRRDWIAFRRWVTRYRTSNGVPFRILGRLDRTWDWPHVELPSGTLGFGSIDDAVARARSCLAPGTTVSCNFPPHLPPRLAHPLVR
ncbi:MAG TPA: M15 family metallopeptidase [Gemmatimonadaceae bacterium]|nr:M15 family metallopeptidase [Gemmatimonadaceae bacterium]